MDKKLLVRGMVAAVLGIILIVGAVFALFPLKGHSGSYILATPYPEQNETYPVVRTVSQELTDEDVRHIETLFNASKDSALEVSRHAGTFRYSIPDKDYPYFTGAQPDIPSDEEARIIATRFLRERGLLPGNTRFSGVSFGSGYGECDGHSCVEYVLTKRVTFEREVHGIPVYGGGITVTIGESGEVVGVDWNIRDFEPVPDRYVRIITPEEAYGRLLSDQLIMLPMSGREGVVRDISLFYWERDYGEYLPVYAFSTDSRKFYVWAVDSTRREDVK